MNSAIVELDLHGMTKAQAKLSIDGLLKRTSKNVYRVRIVHGYNSGTEIKDMIRKSYSAGKHKKVLRLEFGLNPGETDLILREL
jgi:DNA-nicking Smr family endonuclease